MANVSNPLLDFSKSLVDLDLTKGADEFLKNLAQLNVPGIDMDTLVASQRDDLEALTKANRATCEGMKALSELQVKILKEAIDEISNVANGLAKAGSPQDLAIKQTELAKQAFQTPVAHMRELAELINKANKEVTDTIVERVPDHLDEIKDILKIKRQSTAS